MLEHEHPGKYALFELNGGECYVGADHREAHEKCEAARPNWRTSEKPWISTWGIRIPDRTEPVSLENCAWFKQHLERGAIEALAKKFAAPT